VPVRMERIAKVMKAKDTIAKGMKYLDLFMNFIFAIEDMPVGKVLFL
jgi:hypothetical protein